jgi:hypothetical protein
MVVLLGTTSSGETLPVLVDQFGNLLAKGIEGPPGSEGPQGPEGPQGDPGLQGEGVPQPYGDENDVLQINGGVPVWQPLFTPEPPILGPYASWENVETTANCTDASGNDLFPPNKLEYLESLDSWLDTTSKSLAGSLQPAENLSQEDQWLDFRFQESFGMVFTLYWSIVHNNPTTSATKWAVEWNCDNSDVNLINARPTSWTDQGPNRDVWVSGYTNWTINREISSARFSWNIKAGYCNIKEVMFRGWELEDAGTYALKNQLKVQEEMDALRQALLQSGRTTDIDLSRPTQD